MRTHLFYLVLLVSVVGLAGSASADLVGYWKLDDVSEGVAEDSSGNGNLGTLDGGPTVVEGQHGSALAFDNSRVAIPASDTLTGDLFTGDFTLVAWINPTRTGNTWQQIFRAMTSSASNDTLFINNDGHLTWRGHVNGGWTVLSSTAAGAVPADQWTHAAVVGDATGFRIYVNGDLSQESARQVTDGSNATYYIGGDPGAAGESYRGAADEVAVFSHVLTEGEIKAAMQGIAGAELAGNPFPADEATDVPPDVVLSWGAGEFAATHDVYFGTSFQDVNAASRSNPLDVLVSQGQSAASYDPDGSLDFSQTYYWRIDEVNAAPDNTIFQGEVWSFTVEPVAYRIDDVTATSSGISEEGAGPENTVNGSGLNEADQHSTVSADMWAASPPADEPLWLQYEFDRVYKLHELLVWNYNVQFEMILGFGLKDVTMETSTDGVEWTTLGDAQFNQATGKETYVYNTAVDLQGVAARYVRLIVNSGFGTMGQYGLSEVRFTYIPVQAREPQPVDGQTDVDVNTTLDWRAGREAVSHEVYLSTDEGAVAESAALADVIEQASYAPADLEFGTMYHWKVVEVNEAEAISAWESDIWSFITEEYASIDGFESYTDDIDAGEAIFDTWIDGWVNDTGSTVGYFDAPFAETSIVNSGAQSMPLQYDNTESPFYSETARTWDNPQDWTGNGADTLVVNFRGNPPVFLERADGSILMGSTGGDIWGTADAFRFAYKRLSGDGSITARVDSLVNTAGWTKGGVMIRESLDAGSKHAMTVLTPGNGVALQHRPTMNQASLNINEPGLVAPYWVRITRTGETLTAERSEDGTTWTSITADAAASLVTVPMANDVYVGLALVSNNAGAGPTAAEFSNISTTGNVTGQWQTEDIGGGQLASNDPEPLYVAVEDSSGNVQVVINEDPEAALKTTWQEWQIPYSALEDVNLSRVTTMYIGVGDRNNPAAGGTGTLFVDDIGFGSPYVEPAEPVAP